MRKPLEDTRKRIAKANEYVNKDYDLIFVYNPLTDIAFRMTVKLSPSTKNIA